VSFRSGCRWRPRLVSVQWALLRKRVSYLKALDEAVDFPLQILNLSLVALLPPKPTPKHPRSFPLLGQHSRVLLVIPRASGVDRISYGSKLTECSLRNKLGEGRNKCTHRSSASIFMVSSELGACSGFAWLWASEEQSSETRSPSASNCSAFVFTLCNRTQRRDFRSDSVWCTHLNGLAYLCPCIYDTDQHRSGNRC
jgi:hypothetical protein